MSVEACNSRSSLVTGAVGLASKRLVYFGPSAEVAGDVKEEISRARSVRCASSKEVLAVSCA